jgi:hypothetical protein
MTTLVRALADHLAMIERRIDAMERRVRSGDEGGETE